MLDNVLTALLVVIVPCFKLAQSHAERGGPERPRLQRYGRAIVLALLLLLVLATDWAAAGRPLGALGLGAPVTLPALLGLALAAFILGGTGISMRRPARRKPTPSERAAYEMFPTTRGEWRLFIPFCLVAAFAWEVLYRGYLIWALAPIVGQAGAVGLAALSYGMAHGFRTPRLFAASLASAVVFTGAYVAMGNLWGLMLLHAGLPLLSAQRVRANGLARGEMGGA